MMSATLIVRHSVADFATWRKGYDQADSLRAEHGCSGERVLRAPGDANDVLVIHEFPTVAQAEAFVGNPALGEAMQRAGVAGVPRIEIFQSA